MKVPFIYKKSKVTLEMVHEWFQTRTREKAQIYYALDGAPMQCHSYPGFGLFFSSKDLHRLLGVSHGVTPLYNANCIRLLREDGWDYCLLLIRTIVPFNGLFMPFNVVKMDCGTQTRLVTPDGVYLMREHRYID